MSFCIYMCPQKCSVIKKSNIKYLAYTVYEVQTLIDKKKKKKKS